MQVTNSTHWSTKDITKLIFRVAKDELDRGGLKHARVRIKYRRRNGGWGNCTYGTGLNPRVNMMIGLPRIGPIDVAQIANIIAHELAHAKGLRHRDMKNSRYDESGDWRERYAWASEYKINETPKPTKPSKQEKLLQCRTDALIKAEKMVKKWECQVKRSNTALLKWRKRLRAAERRVGDAVLIQTQDTDCADAPELVGVLVELSV